MEWEVDNVTVSAGYFLNASRCDISFNGVTFLNTFAGDSELIHVRDSEVNVTNFYFLDGVSTGHGFVVDQSSVRVVNLTVDSFHSDGGDFFHVLPFSTLSMQEVELRNITSSGYGGAIHATTDTQLDVEDFVFADNKALTGFAIYTEGDLRMKQGTFENNNRYSDALPANQRAMIYHTGDILVVDYATFSGTDRQDNYVYSTARIVLRNIEYPQNEVFDAGVEADVAKCGETLEDSEALVCDPSAVCENFSGDRGLLCECAAPAFGDPTIEECQIPEGIIAIVPDVLTFSMKKPSEVNQTVFFINQGVTSVEFELFPAAEFCQNVNNTGTPTCQQYLANPDTEAQFLFHSGNVVWEPTTGTAFPCNYMEASLTISTTDVPVGTYRMYYVVSTPTATTTAQMITIDLTITADVDAESCEVNLEQPGGVTAGDTIRLNVTLNDLDGLVIEGARADRVSVQVSKLAQGTSWSDFCQLDDEETYTYTCKLLRHIGDSVTVEAYYDGALISAQTVPVTCPDTYELHWSNCTCPPGTYEVSNGVDSWRCDPCPLGMYSEEFTTTEQCIECQLHLPYSSTEGQGSTSPDQCSMCVHTSFEATYENGTLVSCGCSPGFYLSSGNPVCLACPADTYKEGTDLAMSCDACPEFSTTGGLTQQTNITACLCGSQFIQNNETMECSCPGGQKLVGSTCENCPRGTYRAAFAENECIACAGEYMTTPSGVLATSSDDCECRDDFVLSTDGVCTCPYVLHCAQLDHKPSVQSAHVVVAWFCSYSTGLACTTLGKATSKITSVSIVA